MKELLISKSKRYDFPPSIEIISHKSKYIILAVNDGKWIVAENGDEVEMFRCLQSGMTVGQVLQEWIGRWHDVLNFLSEIEGRHFEGRALPMEVAAQKFALRLYMTRKCNMRCPHCFLSAGEAGVSELSTDEILKIVREASMNGCCELILTGGEPLLHPGLKEIVVLAKHSGLFVQILSNGVLWTDAAVEDLSPFVDSVQISIDGYNEQSNAMVRGKQNFAKALNTVENLLNRGVFVSVSVTPQPAELERHFDDYKKFASGLLNKFDSKNFEVSFTDEILDGRSGIIGQGVAKGYAFNVKKMNETLYSDYQYKVFLRRHAHNATCASCGFANLTIDSNGDVYYCSRINASMSHGNVRSCSFEKILKDRLRARIATSSKYLMPCKECSLRMVCGGGCRLSNFEGLSRLASIDVSQVGGVRRKCTSDVRRQILDFMIESDTDMCF